VGDAGGRCSKTKWAARVEAWRTSGQSAPVFCDGKGFSPGGLRYWASRLGKTGPGKDVRLARVVRGPRVTERAETPILIEVGVARVGIRRGFDPEALRAVLEVLGGHR
jgi:hypothetical protein